MPFRQVMKYVLRCKRYLRGYGRMLALLGIVINGYALLTLIVPLISKAVFDTVIPNKDTHLLVLLCISMLLLTVGTSGLTSLRGFLQASLGQQLSNDIRMDLYRHILQLPLGVCTRQQVGDLMARVGSDAGRTASFLQDGLTSLISNTFSLLLAVLLIFRTDWKLGLIALAFIPAFGSSFFIYRSRHYRLGRVYYQKEGEFSSAMQEGLSGVQAIKCMISENREVARLQEKASQVIAAKMRLFWVQNWTVVISMVISTASGAVVVLFGAYQVILGRMSIGDIVAVGTWLTMTGGPISQLAQQYLNMQQVIGSVQRVLELLDIPTESGDPRRTLTLPSELGAIRFENVAFSYDPSGLPVLVDVSVGIEKGEKLAIVGSSGAGKTTIVGLLMGLYIPTSGAILIDGYDTSRLRLDSLRSKIALVSQDTFLFNLSVMDNIRYARPDASEDDVVKAAKAAYAHDFISRLPSGYTTVIGERGVTLSGGQRQRLAIAQAFLKDAPILVLDEAMSAVDSEAEEMIQESLRRLMQDKTVVLISHRMSALDLADKIAVLADGTIVATGSHADLLQSSALYRTLWTLQQSGALTLESG